MREATGELNMTVITVVAIAAVSALFYTFVWPSIQSNIRNNACKSMNNGTGAWSAVKSNEKDADGKAIWVCCPPGETRASNKCTSTSVD